MELEHSFSVPVPVARAWDVLLDVERVAPCMPGATLDSVDGDTITGKIKVKVGPIQMIYSGTARFTERDADAHVVVLEAAGKETRGAGTAAASVRSQLSADGDQTWVTVHTTLNVTGKPAQFGRGVMTEVGSRLIGIFADNLAAMLAAQPAADDTSHQDGNVAVDAGGTPDESLPIDVLNLSTRAWTSLLHDGIQTLGDLTRRTEQQLRAIDGVGPASVADIRGKLADRGLALAPAEGPVPAAAGHARPEGTAADGLRVADLNGDRPVAGKHAGPDSAAEQAAADGAAESGAGAGEDWAEVTPLRPAKHEAAAAAAAPAAPAASEPDAWQPPDNDAIDLLDVAGLPVLKRALPAAAALVAVILVVVGVRRRRARRR